MLTELNLAKNKFGKKTAPLLGHLLRYCTSLTSLDLHENELDDAAATALGKSLVYTPHCSHSARCVSPLHPCTLLTVACAPGVAQVHAVAAHTAPLGQQVGHSGR
jgi:hypothetical protein